MSCFKESLVSRSWSRRSREGGEPRHHEDGGVGKGPQTSKPERLEMCLGPRATVLSRILPWSCSPQARGAALIPLLATLVPVRCDENFQTFLRHVKIGLRGRQAAATAHLQFLRRALKVGDEYSPLSGSSKQEGRERRPSKYSRTSLDDAVTSFVLFIIKRAH